MNKYYYNYIVNLVYHFTAYEVEPNAGGRVRPDPKDTDLSVRRAAFQAWFGQEQELAATRQRILAFAQGTNDKYTADRATKACCILPPADRVELEAARDLGRTEVKVSKSGDWNDPALRMAEYRQGNDTAAEEALRAAADAGKNNISVTGIAAFYRAMSLYRLGRPEEARQVATAATARMKQLPQDEDNPLPVTSWHDDLIPGLADREAKALIQFDAAPPPAGADRK